MSRFESSRTYGEYTPWTRTHTHKRWRLLSRQSPAWWTVEGLKEQRQSAMTGLGTAVQRGHRFSPSQTCDNSMNLEEEKGRGRGGGGWGGLFVECLNQVGPFLHWGCLFPNGKFKKGLHLPHTHFQCPLHGAEAKNNNNTRYGWNVSSPTTHR